MRTFFKMILLCFLMACSPVIVLGAYSSCGSNCYLAKTPSAADVQSAIDAAIAASGGTVQIPAGSATYSTGVAKTITKDLKIIGAGQGSTIIKDSTGTGSGFSFRIDDAVRFEMAHMKLIGKTGLNTNSTLEIKGTSPSVVVHDMYFDGTGMTGGRLVLWGAYDSTQGGGVFYKCTWYNPTGTGQGISLFGKAAPYWVDNPSWGSDKIKYIESCTFEFTGGMGDGALDAYYGAKGVFRYNKVIGTSIGWHGNDSSKSAHSFEIYNNTFSSPLYASRSIGIRGGTALIYNNVFDSNYSSKFLLSHYRGCASWWQKTFGWTSGWCANGYPGDGSYDASGYRCQQQPGTTGADGMTNWPVIEWNNSHNGGVNNMGFEHNVNFIAPACTSPYTQKDYVKEERDFLSHSTCSDGVDNDGDGNVDMSDGQCATFWDSSLKRAQNYTPLPYPHPLTGWQAVAMPSPATEPAPQPTESTATTTTTIRKINPAGKIIVKKIFNR